MAGNNRKKESRPKQWAFQAFLFIMGTLLPPIAVGFRFGAGKDLWLNILLTLCGYIPGHGHNFYIQNIRNNKTKKRTDTRLIKAGLISGSHLDRKEKKSRWANQYKDRLPGSTWEGLPVEEGEVAERHEYDGEGSRGENENRYWNPEEERYFNNKNGRSSASLDSGSGSTGGGGSKRWHYPTNFDDADLGDDRSTAASVGGKKKKKSKKDRWERTEEVYSMPAEEIDGSSKKKKKKSKKRRSIAGDEGMYNGHHGEYEGEFNDRRSDHTGMSTGESEFPEDPEGGQYRSRQPDREAHRNTTVSPGNDTGVKRGGDDLAHDF